MTQLSPQTAIDLDYSYPNAVATPWNEAVALLEQAEIFWLSTVRPDGRPHVTPLIGVWLDDALYFCTGTYERKAKNIAQNPHVVVTTGRNTMHDDNLDLMIEGDAERVLDEDQLKHIAEQFEQKYGSEWHFDVEHGGFRGQEGNIAAVFAVQPMTAFGFGKGSIFSQTRWQF